MFKSSFLFELKYRLKSAGTWICFIALLLMSYREMLAGEWDLLIQSGRVARNSPYTVYYLFMYYTFWAATVGSALMIPTLLRDLKSGTAEMLYSFPLASKQYFLGKYCASILIFILVMSSVVVGFITMPYVTATFGIHPSSDFVAMPWAHIGHAFLLWVLPACFVYGSLTFALTALTGRAGPAYALMMLAVGLFVMITALYGDGAPKSSLVQILDPLGKVTVEGQIYYWTAEERMENFLVFEGELLQNRLLYIIGAVLLLLVALVRFDVCQLLQQAKNRGASRAGKIKAKATAKAEQSSRVADKHQSPAALTLSFTPPGNRYWLIHALSSGWRLFCVVLTNKAFYLSMLTLILMLVLAGFSYEPVDFEGSGKLLPKALLLLPGLMYPSLIFTLVAIAFFSIELCDREKSFRLDQLVESCPVPTWSLLLAKLAGVMYMALILSFVPVVSVLLVQYGQGFFETSWSVIGHVTFLVLLPLMLAYGLISVICYAVFRNKALAQSVAVILCITPAIFNEVKTVENFMYLWAWPFFVQLSEFEASGQFLQRNQSFAFYWLSLYATLLVIAYWLWPRGINTSLKARLLEALTRVSPVSAVMACLFCLSFVWIAQDIHSGMIVRNQYQSSDQQFAEQADYEIRYGTTRHDAQPKIIAADLNVELFPKERRANYSAQLKLKNKHSAAVSELILNYADFTNISLLEYNQQVLQPVDSDAVHRRLHYQLPSPLQPGEIAQLNVKLEVAYEGFSNDEFEYHGTIVADGSFFDSALWPAFGYDKSREIRSVGLRQEYGLGEKQLAASSVDNMKGSDFAVTDDADFITSRVTISTDIGQVALAPGNLVLTQEKAGRQLSVYQSEQVLPWDLHMVSASYQLAQDSWHSQDGGETVQLEIYHHPEHGQNVPQILIAAKQALSEGYRQWGAFPYSSLRIAEVPNGMTKTQVSGNLLVIPENQVWLHDYRQQPATDWITFQIARDVSRVWWQQVPVADLPGRPLIDEAIPVLQGLKAVEAKLGEESLAVFVDQISDNYLRERTTEDKFEAETVKLDTESYADSKAVLALYSAYRLSGNQLFSQQLSHFFHANNKRQKAPFVKVDDLVQLLLSASPNAELQNRLSELFNTTRYYDFRVASTQMSANKQKNYQLKAMFSASEYRYHAGKDKESGYQGFALVKVLGGEQGASVLYEEPLQFKQGQAQLKLELTQKPELIIVNPLRQMLERSPSNNSMVF